jgi:hypothetical protein
MPLYQSLEKKSSPLGILDQIGGLKFEDLGSPVAVRATTFFPAVFEPYSLFLSGEYFGFTMPLAKFIFSNHHLVQFTTGVFHLVSFSIVNGAIIPELEGLSRLF